MKFTSDAVTDENHERITSPLTEKIIIHSKPSICLFLISFFLFWIASRMKTNVSRSCVRCHQGWPILTCYFDVRQTRVTGVVTDYYCVHYNDVMMSTIASQITSLTIVYSIVYSDADQRKHQSSASLAFVRGIHRWPVNSPHKWPVTRKMFPFDDVIMKYRFTKQMTSYAENVSISWRHHGISIYQYIYPFGKCVECAQPLPGRTNWRHHVHVSWLIVERTDLWGILNLNPRWTQAVNRQLHVCLNVVFVVNDCVMNPYPW